MPDRGRRKALAGYVTAKGNYYFAAAFVNRAWGELMGQAFVMPAGQPRPAAAGAALDPVKRSSKPECARTLIPGRGRQAPADPGKSAEGRGRTS